jgi:hypothetical protein
MGSSSIGQCREFVNFHTALAALAALTICNDRAATNPDGVRVISKLGMVIIAAIIS